MFDTLWITRPSPLAYHIWGSPQHQVHCRFVSFLVGSTEKNRFVLTLLRSLNGSAPLFHEEQTTASKSLAKVNPIETFLLFPFSFLFSPFFLILFFSSVAFLPLFSPYLSIEIASHSGGEWHVCWLSHFNWDPPMHHDSAK